MNTKLIEILGGEVMFTDSQKYSAKLCKGVFLGTVMNKIASLSPKKYYEVSHQPILELVRLWQPCGFERSLQDILSDVEEVCMNCTIGHDCECEEDYTDKPARKPKLRKHLKPESKNLEDFLNTIFL